MADRHVSPNDPNTAPSSAGGQGNTFGSAGAARVGASTTPVAAAASVAAIVAVNDSAAFYVGRRFGRRKLSPHVSPNKSWEGSAAGVAGAVAATAVWSRLVLETWEPRLVLLGVLVAVAGQCGDLVESMLKRGAGVKDSGTLLPGHGGVLDRVDAFLFAAPVLLLGLHGFGLGRLLE